MQEFNGIELGNGVRGAVEQSCSCGGMNENCRWCNGTGTTSGPVPRDHSRDRRAFNPPRPAMGFDPDFEPLPSIEPARTSMPVAAPAPLLVTKQNRFLSYVLRALFVLLFLSLLRIIGC